MEPYFSTPPSTPFFHFMAFYARRLAAMGRERRRRGVFGLRNANRRFMFGGFSLQWTMVIPILKALGGWAWLELTEGWRTWTETTARGQTSQADYSRVPNPQSQSSV